MALKLNRLKIVLVERDVSAKELAEKLGVTPQTVSTWTKNKNQPPLLTFFQIAQVLNVDVRTLITESKDVGTLEIKVNQE